MAICLQIDPTSGQSGERSATTSRAALAADVAAGLQTGGQKSLPCKYLYDAIGSILFEAICALPEYGLTAADGRLLRSHARQILTPFLPTQPRAAQPQLWIAELGCGNGQKTHSILAAACRCAHVLYAPIEVSSEALRHCQQTMEDLEELELIPYDGDYLAGLQALSRNRQQSSPACQTPLLALFLGSSLGNFDPETRRAFLTSVRQQLRPGDGLLLGLDLADDPARLHAAYDDPAGVTAAFNRNLLVRLNRELGADFDLNQWQHRVRYRRRERRVEMHLRSRRAQHVAIPGAGITVSFRRGETIWTESSYKFRAGEIAGLAAECGFELKQQWTDPLWPVAENLLEAR